MYHTARQLFKGSSDSLGSRQLCKNLRRAGFNVGSYRTRSIMRKL
ncbi:MAG: putative transposase, partial [Marinobacter maritimus]